jgi:hypothetical protein
MSSEKFIRMIEFSSLFFPLADRFEDRFEGSYPKADIRRI